MICPINMALHGTVPPFSGPEISTDQGSHIEWLNIIYKCTWSMLKAESWVVERCVVVQQLLLLHPSTLARYLQQLMAEELPTARYILTGHPTIAKERSLFQVSNTQMKLKMSKDVFQFSSCSLAFKLLLRHTTALYLHNDNVWFVLSDSIQWSHFSCSKRSLCGSSPWEDQGPGNRDIPSAHPFAATWPPWRAVTLWLFWLGIACCWMLLNLAPLFWIFW